WDSRQLFDLILNYRMFHVFSYKTHLQGQRAKLWASAVHASTACIHHATGECLEVRSCADYILNDSASP
ncbi:MAG TPA: hypothetical protein VF974_00210, partial [Patescibacteria group bacterium]